MNPDNERSLLLTIVQVANLLGYRRSKIYALMHDPVHPFPAQACRGRWRRSDVERWVAELGKGSAA